MKTIISEKERGLKFKNGSVVKLLQPGKHTTFGYTSVLVLAINQAITNSDCPLTSLMKNKQTSDALEFIEVKDYQVALHYVDGCFEGFYTTGKYAFWKVYGEHQFTFVDITDPEVDENIPRNVFDNILMRHYKKIDVAQYQKARLYYNNKFVKLLDAGTHYFWDNGTKITAEVVDTRLLQMDIAGQEMLTLDKVALRINFVCNYKITDYIKVATEVKNYETQLHIAAQLALRDYIGRYKLDEILENKESMSKAIFEKLKEAEKDLYICIHTADVKDIILPGEIRDIMNTVLIAEKKAQANVITRREEVASTRSLLNTAKLLDENPTLYRLKEMEYVERICENVGNINVNGNGDLLSQLSSILQTKK